jgi:hypothetical protein
MQEALTRFEELGHNGDGREIRKMLNELLPEARVAL